MTQPNQKPTAYTPVAERSHSDPPGLWAIVVLSSLVIHLFAFGMLRLWMMVRLNHFPAARIFIPIDVIAVASEGQISLPPTPATTSTITQNPPSANTPTNSVPNTPASSSSVPSNSPQTKETTASGTTNSSPSKGVPIATNSPTTKPAQNQSPETPKPSRSPTPTPSNNQPSGTQTPSSNPNSPGNQGNQTNGSTPSPSPSPFASTGSPAGQNSSNSKQGGGFIVALGRLEPVSNAQDVLHINDGDKLATCESDSNPLPSDYLTPLGITLDKALPLKVEVLIDNLGKATLLRLLPQALPQNLSAPQAEQLAKKLVEQQQCTPTQMAGKPVYRDYSLTLTISPTQN
ncbi:hypothetical protein [Allocoleopsis franciscana]|uniref:Uncharacterized protein n=1 Tax=Allocoleopsis franciscana PCC 7113 TaxID=1173027 RepID=K9W706_9CYAN|nr:hypothetical protein [Allocoleopsis franciscana]AFZ16003.1 hypothetical protein Mic7113_0060 [Allocoleopsis franciscana PCC 7113]